MASETRDEWLAALALRARDGYQRYCGIALTDGQSHVVAESAGWCGAAHTVYAQAVRDLLADIERDGRPWYPDDVIVFAAERGLALEENGHE